MRLMEMIPDFWDRSAEVVALQGAMDPAVAEAWAARDGLLEQLNVATATCGLELWETSLGLEVDVSKPDEYRRTRILSKLRGQGTTTVAMIKNVAESFSNGAVEVREHPVAYRFEIEFVGTIGIPPNMDDLTAAIEEIKPAHLGYAYVYLYCTWAMVEGMRWTELTAHTWAQVRNGDALV